MNEIRAWLFFSNTIDVIWGVTLDATALTCFVCSSRKLKDCSDPLDERSETYIPYFECNRLYGALDDDPSLQYKHFRPTNHGKPTIPTKTKVPTMMITNATKTSNTTMKLNTTMKFSNATPTKSNLSATSTHSTMRTSISSMKTTKRKKSKSTKNRKLVTHHNMSSEQALWEVMPVFYDLLRRKKWIQEYAVVADSNPMFSPFQTQGRPKGLKERPQHYCYKVIIEEGAKKIVERGCTNVTTKVRACDPYYRTSKNVSICDFCGLNFCNGARGTTTVGNFEVAISFIIVYSMIV